MTCQIAPQFSCASWPALLLLARAGAGSHLSASCLGLVWQPLGLTFVAARVALLQSFVCATCASMRGCPTARARDQRQAQRGCRSLPALQTPRRRSCRPRPRDRLWRPRRSLSRGLARFYKTCFRLAKRRRASECSTSNAAQTVALIVSLAHALLPYVVNALLKSLPRQQPPDRL